MNCRTCGQEMHERGGGNADHHLHKFAFGGRCLGCEMFSLEMMKFLIRANGRVPMGDWTEGWMKEIIANPTKDRGM